MKKTKFSLKITTIIIVLVVVKFWVGIYTHDEFGTNHIFIKHRPLWKSFFISPRGMSDLKNSEMSLKRQNEQELFDEFIIETKKIE